MSSRLYIGRIPGQGSLIRCKRQRKTGGAKNVFILGMNPNMVNDEIKTTLKNFGGEQYERGNNAAFVFTKRAAAEKAWIWFLLKYS